MVGFFSKTRVPQERPAPIAWFFPPPRETSTALHASITLEPYSTFNIIKQTQVRFFLDIIRLCPDNNLESQVLRVFPHMTDHLWHARGCPIRVVLIKHLTKQKTLNAHIHRLFSDVLDILAILWPLQGRFTCMLSPIVLAPLTTHSSKVKITLLSRIIVIRLGIDSFCDKHPVDCVWLGHFLHDIASISKVWRIEPCFERSVQIVTLRTIDERNRALGIATISRQKSIGDTAL